MENKIGRYLKYAIGEIILVVIGIIIALEINNWNENNKQRAFEVKMLIEIKNALASDIDYFNMSLQRLIKLEAAADKFLKLVHEKATFIDADYRKGYSRWYHLRTGINIQYNSGPYEALKSSGIDKVSNDSLRNSLVDFYDFKLPAGLALINYYDRTYDDDADTLTSFLGKPYTELIDGKIKVYSKFPEDLLQKTEFLKLLTRIKVRASSSNRLIQKITVNMQNLKTQVLVEINK